MPIFILTLCFLALSPPAWSEGSVLRPELDEVQKKLLIKHRLERSQVSFSLYDISADAPLELANAEEALTLASVSKILTALFTLSQLKESERPETRLYFSGQKNRETGLWRGDLTLVGGGDPMLDIPEFMDALLTLKAKGLKKFEGNFFYDQSLFPALSEISSLGWEDQTYNPGFSALSSHFNRFHIYGEDNTPLPQLEVLKVSKSKNKLPFDLAAISKGELQWELSSDWSLKPGAERDLPVRSPARFSAELMRHLGKLVGLELPAASEKKGATKGDLVWSHQGLTFMRLIELTLEYSNNLLAETLLFHGAKIVSPKLASADEAGAILTKWLKEKYSVAKNAQMNLVCGSGLCPANKISALQLTKILAREFVAPSIRPSLISLLSVGGHSGWISNRFKAPNERYRIWAKTGSLDFVSNMAGYLFTNGENPKVFAFSIFVIDEEKRKVLDLGSSDAAVEISKGAPDFRNRATALTEEWLAHWIEKY